MSRININQIYQITKEHYDKAKNTLDSLKHSLIFERADAISDTIPGYHAEYLEFGSFAKDNFAVLFVPDAVLIASKIFKMLQTRF